MNQVKPNSNNLWNNIKTITITILLLFSIFMSFTNILENPELQNYENENIKYNIYQNNTPSIRIINIKGVISYEKALKIIKEIKSSEKSSNTKAIIIRVNSPGGTVGASQIIYDKIIKFKNKTKKPVYVVFADVAASGGYYIAMAADEIFAQPGTITGSIGVIILGYNLEALFKKLGISQEVTKSGKFKDIMSLGRKQTLEEKQILQEIVDTTYKQFYNVVKKGRKNKLSIANLKKYTDGRIFNGEIAKSLGFIDSIGGLDEAVNKIKKLLKIKQEVKLIEHKNDFIDQISKYFKYKNQSAINTLFNNHNGMPLYLYTGIIK